MNFSSLRRMDADFRWWSIIVSIKDGGDLGGFMSIRNLCFAAVMMSLCSCASVKDVQDFSGILAPGDGVLVVVVDTMLPFNDLRLTRPGDTFHAIAARDLQKGRSVRFIEVPAGEYQWTEVDLSNSGYYVPLNRDKKLKYTFTVKPGVINYPGDLMISVDEDKQIFASALLYGAIHKYYVQLIDRNAMLLDDLTPDQAKMVRRLGLVYTGPGLDTFADYYKSVTSAHKGAP